MRGNPERLAAKVLSRRSIPAYAGEPLDARRQWRLAGVYPRVCGGTPMAIRITRPSPGLSPRMRGNHLLRSNNACTGRSIPAYAGEPARGGKRAKAPDVYPRVCGGTRGGGAVGHNAAGLSPRMRGNRMRRHARILPQGSIPAYAGEPALASGQPGGGGVYPRVCGGTIAGQRVRRQPQGLSPRMRGNPGRPLPDGHRRWSIPAYAGEPPNALATTSPTTVYPRVCGGTRAVKPLYPTREGLSPRMRGNRYLCRPDAYSVRSIPAYAGEPRASRQRAPTVRVYPRVCGGTGRHRRPKLSAGGLSPRMRGNLSPAAENSIFARSIPAYAGEPIIARNRVKRNWVYPRVCGGTRQGCWWR